MPKEGLTEIICVIDKSGSMHKTADDAIGGFNAFLEGQRMLPGEAKLTLILFDNDCHVLHEGECLDNICELSSRNYIPSGGTALLDAVGLGIDRVNDNHKALSEEERPEKIMMVVITDGKEGSSKEYTRDVLMSKISECREKNWEFVFLGADESAFTEAKSMGFSPGMTKGFRADTGGGTRSMYSDMTSMVSSYRSGKPADLSVIEDSKKDEDDEGDDMEIKDLLA